MTNTDTARRVSRRLRDLCEPIAGSVYFVPEAQEAYGKLGFENYAQSYFCSRGACLGRPSGEVVTAAFGVFNPAIVVPAVESGWSKTDPESTLGARLEGATAALHRMLGEADPAPVVGRLRGVMESVDYAGRAIYAGLRSLAFPDDPLGQLWRVCDYVRERRGDGHIAAWVSAGCDAIEIGLLTELHWGLELATYIRTRGWSQDEINDGIRRLESKGYIHDGAFTDEGREYRRGIEAATDAMEDDVVSRLEDPDELFALMEPFTKAVLEAGGYPVDPARTMSADN
ncbi:MAG TPA: hypothetical protein VFA34_00870 [Actinomycetota bacterium]|jgi:hypothetical protein|nr:hypothetical protein [Actinomycetota bacterium]